MSNQIKKKEFSFFSAENLTQLVSDAIHESNPAVIDIFNHNILKAKILLISAERISELIEKIHPRLGENDFGVNRGQGEGLIADIVAELTKLATSGSAIYLAYTGQSIVCAVTAFETYFRDRLANAICVRPELANRFADKEIKVKRIIEINFDVKSEIGNLIVERNMDFQNLKEVLDTYNRVFGEMIFNEGELVRLKQIFQIRHLIVHKGGIVDRCFKAKTDMSAEVGKQLMLSRDEVKDIIEFIEATAHRIEEMLSRKLAIQEEDDGVKS